MEAAAPPRRRHDRVAALVCLAVAAAVGVVLLHGRHPLPAGRAAASSDGANSGGVRGGPSPSPPPPPDSLTALAAALTRRRADALRAAVRNVTIPALPSLGTWKMPLWGGADAAAAGGVGTGGGGRSGDGGGDGGGGAPPPGRGVVNGAASMFTAKHREAWATHCDAAATPYCRAVYRLVVRTDAAHILDVGCGANTGWLPKVLSRLAREYRRVHLTCVGVGGAAAAANVGRGGGDGDDPLARARLAYAPYAGHVDYVVVPAMGLPSGAPDHLDVVLALHVLPRLSLIQAVRFFASLRDAGASTVIVDHYPAVQSNAGGAGEGGRGGRGGGLGGGGGLWSRGQRGRGGGGGGGGHRYNLRLSPFSFVGEAFAWPLVDAAGGETGREVLGVDVDKMFHTVPEMM